MNSPRRWRGAALVEFALVLIPLLIIVLGISELGRALYQENTLAKSVAVGARYIVRTDGLLDWNDCSINSGTEWSAVQQAARNLVVCGDAAGCEGKEAVVPRLKPEHIHIPEPVSVAGAPGRAVCRITVEARVPFAALFGDGVVPFTGIGAVELNARTEERWIGG